ncbi:Pentatricopeptide repeat-containing protein At1g06710, partial [Durusdinium trenchii]
RPFTWWTQLEGNCSKEWITERRSSSRSGTGLYIGPCHQLRFEMILMRGQTRADVVSFNALIDAWVKAEDVQRAKYWLERMLEVGVEPTVISYTTVLNAYAKQGNIEAAEEIMEQMKSKQLE